jgi:hypothetical protein
MADKVSNMSDAAFLAMAESLASTVKTSPTAYGLTALWVTDFETQIGNFDAELGEHVQMQAQAKAKTIAKDAQRDVVEGLVRDARLLAKAAKISESKYTEMGIPSGSESAPANATVPAVAVNTGERLRHTIDWTDAATLDNKKKPRGVMGAEIWVKLDGPPPGSEKDCTFLSLDSSTPYVAEYQPEWGGKTAHYLVRWRMRDGSALAWGETVSATITA